MMKRNEVKYKSGSDPLIHAKIRSREVEIAAVREAIGYVTSNSNLHFTHISSEGSLEMIKEAKKSLKIS